MANGQFEQQFGICTTQEGAAYTAARDAVIAMGAAVLPQLEQKADSADWREQLAAEILTGWITRRELFEQVTSEVRAEWASSSVTGQLSPTKRARLVAALGTEVVPRLLEMLLKTAEYSNSSEHDALLFALNELKDRRAVMPLISLVTRPGGMPTEKVLALGTLGTLRDPRAFDVLSSTFTNRDAGKSLRSTAAVALGVLADRRATDAVVAAMQDQSEDIDVRRHAARALGHLGDRNAGSALATVLRREQEPGLALAIVRSLGQLRDPGAAVVLEEVGRTHADDTVRLAAQETRQSLLA